MNLFKRQSYPMTAKVILAALILGVAWTPSILRSADKKTRQHPSAREGRVALPKTATEKAAEEEAARQAEEAAQTEAVKALQAEEQRRLAEEKKAKRLADKQAAAARVEQARLEKQEKLALEKLRKQLADEKRKAERDLARQLEEEERQAEKALETQLKREEAEALAQSLERIEAEEAAKKIELATQIEADRTVAQEAMQSRLAEAEARGLEAIDERIQEFESESREKLEKRLADEALAAQRKIDKQIADDEKAARKELEKRLSEREQIAKEELESQIEKDARLAREERDRLLASAVITQEALIQELIAEDERAALAEIEKRLLEESETLAEKLQMEDEKKARELVEKTREKAKKRTVQTKFAASNRGKTAAANPFSPDDEYKRPSLWGSVRRAPRQLLAGIGSISLPRKEEYAGYLAYRTPTPLRFSDDSALDLRPITQALPEFSMLAPGQGSVVVQNALTEAEARRNGLVNRVVFELEPHTIVSGKIDTTLPSELEERDRVMVEETEGTVVRPEEVLIFFENEREGGGTKTVVPFSPAIPTQAPPSRSGATYERK